MEKKFKEKFTVDQENVYYQANEYNDKQKLKSISAEEFCVIGGLDDFDDRGYLKNVNGIWWFYDGYERKNPLIKFISEDSTHFKVINSEYAKDSHTVFHAYRILVAIPKSDPDTFQVSEGKYQTFAKDKNQVYAFASYASEGLTIVEGADAATFVDCDYNKYAADKDNLFHFYHVVTHCNDGKYSVALDTKYAYLDMSPQEKLKNNQEYLYEKFPNIKGWWHPQYDKLRIPPMSSKIGFVIKDAVYYLDETSQHLPFCVSTIIRDADILSFSSLDDWYGKDKRYVYYKWRTMYEVDLESFKVLGNRLSCDKNHFYYNGYAVKDVDYTSFQVIEGLANEWRIAAKDANHIYFSHFKRLGKFKGYDDILIATKHSEHPAGNFKHILT